jgi:phosphopantothenoylcysteine decarboxylase
MKKNIILGVTGSVAAIKTAQLAAGLASFANVRIVATHHAEYFLNAQLEKLQQLDIPVYRDRDEWPPLAADYEVGEPILHIEMRRFADVLLIAPLDANTLAKTVHGFCDNLLTSIVRAWDRKKPMLLCPAMNTVMWENPPTAEHIAVMEQRGATIIAPVAKKLACNDIGMGAMAQVDDIIKSVEWLFA